MCRLIIGHAVVHCLSDPDHFIGCGIRTGNSIGVCKIGDQIMATAKGEYELVCPPPASTSAPALPSSRSALVPPESESATEPPSKVSAPAPPKILWFPDSPIDLVAATHTVDLVIPGPCRRQKVVAQGRPGDQVSPAIDKAEDFLRVMRADGLRKPSSQKVQPGDACKPRSRRVHKGQGVDRTACRDAARIQQRRAAKPDRSTILIATDKRIYG